MTPASSPRARPRPWFQRLVLALGVGIVGTLVGVALVAGYVGIRFGQIGRVDNIDLQSAAAGEPANYLIVGTDSRAGLDASDPDAGSFLGDAGCNCTDTIMVVRVDPNEGTASILSFPRDLYLPIAGSGKTARINTAHGQGVQVLIDTIEENFDIPINHYAEIDFVGFEELVDAVGGVPMWFDAPVRDSHTGLSIPGAKCQVLDGQTARRFVRSRYLQYRDADGQWTTDGTADLGRITRQQIFIRRAVAKAVSKGLTNPVTLNTLVGAGVSSVQLDGGLSAGDLLGLGKKFARFNAEDLEGFAIPSHPKTTSGGAMVEIPDMREAEPYLNIFRGLPIGTVTPGVIDVTVLNGSGVTGRAADAAGALQKVGFTITDIDTYSRSDVGRTTVRFGAGGEAIARRVADHISGGVALVPDPNGTAGAVVVVIGTDFTTVHDQPAPEGSVDAGRTTVATTGGASAAGDFGAAATSTTVAGYATGEPPVGVRC